MSTSSKTSVALVGHLFQKGGTIIFFSKAGLTRQSFIDTLQLDASMLSDTTKLILGLMKLNDFLIYFPLLYSIASVPRHIIHRCIW
jgi:hypothetical protein